MDINQMISRGASVPTDGSLFTVSTFLSMLDGNNQDMYRLYDKHLQYFASLYKIKGHEDIERLSPILMRQTIEFGKGAIGKVRDKFVPLAVVDAKHTIDYKVKSVKAITARVGYGYNLKQKQYTFKADEVAVVKNNFNALPFIFYWGPALKNIIKLRDAAITGSIASIKKWKKNMANNSSAIAAIENASMADPSTPFVEVVSNPTSYKNEIGNKQQGNLDKNDINKSTAPNSLTYEGTIDSASGQYENLKNYTEFEYFQLGRRINTNKKNERNIAREIDTETINFDVLEEDFKDYLEMWVKEMNKKFGLSLRLVSVIDEKMNAAEQAQENQTEQSNKPGVLKKLFGKKGEKDER